jgi:hypothetical protein
MMKMKTHLKLSLALSLVLSLTFISFAVSAVVWVPTLSVTNRYSTADPETSGKARTAVEKIIERSAQSGILARFLSDTGTNITQNAEYEIGNLYSMVTISGGKITESSFEKNESVKDILALIYLKNEDKPVLYVSVSTSTSEEWTENSFGAAGNGNIVSVVQRFEAMSDSLKNHSPIIFRYYNDYGISYQNGTGTWVILSSFIAHQLNEEIGINLFKVGFDSETGTVLMSLGEFIRAANEWMEHYDENSSRVG